MTQINLKLDSDLKNSFDKLADNLGLTISNAVREFPFPIQEESLQSANAAQAAIALPNNENAIMEKP